MTEVADGAAAGVTSDGFARATRRPVRAIDARAPGYGRASPGRKKGRRLLLRDDDPSALGTLREERVPR